MCHHKNRPHAENDSKYDRYDSASLVSLASLSFYVMDIAVFFLLKDIISRYFTYMMSHLCHITYVSKGRQAQFISIYNSDFQEKFTWIWDSGGNYIKINKKR